jgi:hypothetical protein
VNTAKCIVRVFIGPRDCKRHHSLRYALACCATGIDRTAEIEWIDPQEEEDGVELAARVVLSSQYDVDAETLKDILFEQLLKALLPESDGQIEVELTDDR